MSGISDDLIEQVRDAADPIDVIGEFVDLRKTGADYRGPCPFHGGTKRNLAIIPSKRIFYCYVCHEGGDVFAFFMKRFGLDYPHAVREVARKVGVTIPDRPTGGADPAEPLYTAVAVAADWYTRRLRESNDAEHARRYLEERRFDLDQLAPFGLGFAPKGSVFLEAMHTLGISNETLIEAGLAVTREDSVRPRFWGRLMIPIHDLRGRVVGFGGRALGDGEPKYLNSPESQVFHKSRLLYNLHTAKQAIRKEGRAVLVEGYFDVIRAVEAGVDNVVAPLGTAFSGDRAQLLKRVTQEVIVFFDSDAAGMRASFRACDELLKASVRALIATAPPGEDPDTLVLAGGPEGLRKILEDAIDVFERKLQLLERKGWFETLAGRRNALDKLLPTMRATADGITRDLYISRAAEVLGVTAESIRREMTAGLQATPSFRRPRHDENVPLQHHMRPERDLVNAMLHDPVSRRAVPEHLADSSVFRQPERELFECLRSAPTELVIADLFEQLSPPARQMLQDLIQDAWSDLKFSEVVGGAISRIQSRALVAQLEELQRQHVLVSDADKPGIQKEIVALRQRVSQLNPARWPVIHG